MATAAASGPNPENYLITGASVMQEEGKVLFSYITSVYTLLQRAEAIY